MIDDHGDAIVQFFREENTDIRKKICVDLISACESTTEEEDFTSDITPPPPTPPPPMPEWNLTDTNATSNETNATEANATTGTDESTDAKQKITDGVKDVLDDQMRRIREVQKKVKEQEGGAEYIPAEVKHTEKNNVDASTQVDTADDDSPTPEHKEL